jgi:hypothetical protein
MFKFIEMLLLLFLNDMLCLELDGEFDGQLEGDLEGKFVGNFEGNFDDELDGENVAKVNVDKTCAPFPYNVPKPVAIS